MMMALIAIIIGILLMILAAYNDVTNFFALLSGKEVKS